MNIILWVLQISVGAKCIATAFSHAFKYSGMFNRPVMIITSVLLFLCAVGLIIPGVFKVVMWIIPLAAIILAVLMIVALVLHLKCPEHSAIYADIILFVLAVFIAIGRKFIVPL